MPAVVVVDTALVTEDATAVPSQRMRRVASAPAFKHVGGYQAPSAAAAVAQAQADAAAEAAANTASLSGPGSSSSSAIQRAPRRRLFTWGTASQQGQRAAAGNSTSNCSTCGGRCNCLEVYVVSRAFTEFGGELLKKLPADAKEHMVDMGICHYMTVFKTPDGKLVQFDFGPLGGDVQVSNGPLASILQRAHAAALAQAGQAGLQLAATGAAAGAGDAGGSSSSSARGMVHSPSAPVLPLASLDLAGEAGEAASAAMRGQAPAQRRKKGVAGEIREKELAALPPASMYMGRTQLSLADIREYNNAQGNLQYTLHDNDCRHYVNSLVQYATGVERSTQHLKRHYFHTRNQDKFLWYGWFISATQLVTDVGNWGHIQAGAAATLIAVTGRSTLAQLKTLALPVMPALTRSLPSLIPSAGLAGAGGAAAGAGAGSVAGGLATTLKLPAALLLKRPLAGSVAAAGGAGAAAAAIRTVPGNADSAAAAAAGSGSSSNRSFGGFGGWSRPLLQWKDGLGNGFKGAMLSLRRAAVGSRAAVEQLQPAAAPAPAASELSSAATRGWFGRPRANRQLAAAGMGGGSGMVMAAAAPAGAAVMALPSPDTAPPRGRWGGRGSNSSGRSSGSGGGSGVEDVHTLVPDRRQQRGPGLVTGLGHHVGRHVMWLGSTAAKATGTIAVLASKQVGYLVGARGSPGAAAAALGGGPVGLSHSTASLLLHQQNQQQQQQQQRSLMGQRSRSAPSLAVVAAAAAAAAGTPGQAGAAGGAAAAAGSEDMLVASAVLDDPVFGSGSSSVTCSSIGGRSSGVGRQVLNLPAPRISWAKRASHVMMFGQ